MRTHTVSRQVSHETMGPSAANPAKIRQALKNSILIFCEGLSGFMLLLPLMPDCCWPTTLHWTFPPCLGKKHGIHDKFDHRMKQSQVISAKEMYSTLKSITLNATFT